MNNVKVYSAKAVRLRRKIDANRERKREASWGEVIFTISEEEPAKHRRINSPHKSVAGCTPPACYNVDPMPAWIAAFKASRAI